MDVTETLIDLRAAARLVGLSPAALRERIRHGGDMPSHYRLGKKVIRFDADEFNAWLEKHRVPAGQEPRQGGGEAAGNGAERAPKKRKARTSHPRLAHSSRSTPRTSQTGRADHGR